MAHALHQIEGKTMKKLLALIIPAVFVSNIAIAQFDPNLVGGGDSLGSGVASPFSDIGYASTDDYNNAKANGYGPTQADATLWGHAKKSTNGNSEQLSGSSENYGDVYTNLGNQNGDTVQKNTFQTVFDCTAAVGSPGWDSYADCDNATNSDPSKGYLLTDYTLYGEAKAASATLQLYCAESACTTRTKAQFQTAKTNKSNFDIDRQRGSNGTLDGTLTIADFTTHGVSWPETPDNFTATNRRPWLIAYLNDSDHQSGGNMSDSTHPTLPTTSSTTWQALANAVDLTDAAWWYLQQVAAGNISTPGLSTDLFASAGLGSSYQSQAVVTQVVNNLSTIQADNYSSTSNFEDYIDSLITPTWVGTPATAIVKTVPDATSGSAIVTHTANVTSGSITYSVGGTNGASFSVNSGTGAVTTASNLAGGSYSFNLVATPSVGSAISKTFTVTVNAAPSFAAITSPDVSEDASAGTSVMTVTATDVNGGSLTYSLSGTDAAAFAINSATGAITVQSSSSFDYETATTKAISVTATDNTSLSSTEQVTVNITNADEAPVISASAAASANVDGDDTASFVTITATDPEGDAISYSLTGTNCDRFSVNSSGQISRTSTASVGSYSCNVVASANSLDSSSHALSITVDPYLVQPSITLTAANYVNPNGTTGLSISGGSGSGAVTYSVTSGVCTISGTTLTGGSTANTQCVVQASKAGQGNYLASSASKTIHVVNPISVSPSKKYTDGKCGSSWHSQEFSISGGKAPYQMVKAGWKVTQANNVPTGSGLSGTISRSYSSGGLTTSQTSSKGIRDFQRQSISGNKLKGRYRWSFNYNGSSSNNWINMQVEDAVGQTKWFAWELDC